MIYSSSLISMFWKLVYIKNDLLNVMEVTYVCPVLTTPSQQCVCWHGWTLLTRIPPPQLLSVQGAVGAGACVRAGPQSEAKWPAKPHRGHLLPAGCISGQHGAHAASHHQPVPFCDRSLHLLALHPPEGSLPLPKSGKVTSPEWVFLLTGCRLEAGENCWLSSCTRASWHI